MADIPYIQATLETKIVGQDATGNNVNYVSADASGNMLVKDYADGPVTPGTVASVSTLIGSQFNTTLPTVTTTQQSALQTNQFGMLAVTGRWKFKNISGNATTTVKSGAGTLHTIMINNATTSGIANIYDNTVGSGTLIATITLPSGGINPVPSCMSPLDLEFVTGLTVVTTGSTFNNFTFLYM
jgi:hypothetical protein